MITARRLSLVAATACAAGLAASPALAQTIAAPAGDAGVWAGLNGWLAPVAVTWIGGAVTWAAARFHARTGVAISADLTADVRETATTGLFLAAHEMEVAIDGALALEKREELIVKAVDWVLQRLPGPLAYLKFGEPVVRGIVVKMLGRIVGGSAAAGDTVLNLPSMPGAAALLQGWTREPAAAGQPAADPVGDAVATVEATLGGHAAGVLPQPKA